MSSPIKQPLIYIHVLHECFNSDVFVNFSKLATIARQIYEKLISSLSSAILKAAAEAAAH